MFRLLRPALIVVPLGLAACGGSGAGVSPGPIQCLFNGTSQLVYPIPNATSVPDAPQQIVFATSRLFPSTFNVLVNSDANPDNARNGSGAFFQQIQRSQVPSPSATPSISNAFYESAAITTSFPHGTYYVFLNDSLGGCTPTPAGSFTTQ
jgi:hypothetical protein